MDAEFFARRGDWTTWQRCLERRGQWFCAEDETKQCDPNAIPPLILISNPRGHADTFYQPRPPADPTPRTICREMLSGVLARMWIAGGYVDLGTIKYPLCSE